MNNPEAYIYFHFYKELKSWAVYFSITTRNASIQIFPFWVSIRFPWSKY